MNKLEGRLAVVVETSEKVVLECKNTKVKHVSVDAATTVDGKLMGALHLGQSVYVESIANAVDLDLPVARSIVSVPEEASHVLGVVHRIIQKGCAVLKSAIGDVFFPGSVFVQNFNFLFDLTLTLRINDQLSFYAIPNRHAHHNCQWLAVWVSLPPMLNLTSNDRSLNGKSLGIVTSLTEDCGELYINDLGKATFDVNSLPLDCSVQVGDRLRCNLMRKDYNSRCVWTAMELAFSEELLCFPGDFFACAANDATTCCYSSSVDIKPELSALSAEDLRVKLRCHIADDRFSSDTVYQESLVQLLKLTTVLRLDSKS